MNASYSFFLFGLMFACSSPKKVEQATNSVSIVESPSYQLEEATSHSLYVSYIGRVDDSEKGVVRFSYPGVQVSCFFEGETLSAEITDFGQDNDVNSNYFEILIDGESQGYIELKEGRHLYELSGFLISGKHKITLYKRTESFVGICGFHGFQGEGVFSENRKEEKLKMEFIGNSITCGYGNGLSIPMPPEGNPTTGFTAINENNFMSYSSMVGRRLHAEVSHVCYSGRGVFRNYDGSEEFTIPKTYLKVIPDEPGSKWNFDNWLPDVVLINLGTNDFAKDPELPLVDSLLEEAYRRFLSVIQTKYPSSKIVLLGSPMITDVYPARAKHATRMRRIQNKLMRELNVEGRKTCFYHEFEPQQAPYGEDWHPASHTHEKMSQSLLQFIEDQVLI